jgi:ATP-binding cassette, subfamily B, bacterial CvaB/MchF/RaxB
MIQAKHRRVPMIHQSEIAECGLACVAMISGAYGRRTDPAALRLALDPGTRGASMKDIAALGESLGFAVKSLKVGLKQLDKLRLPAILHWNLVHYVVLTARRGDQFTIHDPAVGRRTIDEAELSCCFTGLAQEFVPRPGFAVADERQQVPLRWLFDRSEPYGRLLATIVLMSLVMQGFVMLLPFAAQLLLDRVAVSRDGTTLALGVALSGLGLGLYCLLLWLRSTVVLYLNNCLDARGSQKLIAKMLGMPYDFFARRDTASLLGRFANLREIRQLLSQGLAESLVEAALSIGVLATLALYLPGVAYIAVAALAVYVAYRLTTRGRQQERVSEMFQSIAAHSGSLVESLHKVETIKANAIEAVREQFWLGRYLEYQNSLVQKLRMDYAQTIALVLSFGLGYAATAWVSVRAIFDGRLSIGEALTVLLLLGIFFARASQFLDRLFELLVARVHLDSLCEIVHGDAEPQGSMILAPGRRAGVIELRGVGFRYSPSEPFIFRNVTFKVGAGECVAITGASGCGKSTLMSLLLGLRTPTEGEVLIDGVPVDALDKQSLRSRVGSVLQSDRLFYGSVLENVTLFELNAPSEQVWTALRACALADVVARLPMREHTMLSDAPMLSGGEVQRVLLARALYKNPPFLLLDEASSHLDDATEAHVNDSLRASGATRLIVAHRKQTIELADTVVRLGRCDVLGCSTVLEILRNRAGDEGEPRPTRAEPHADALAPVAGS